MIRGHRKYVLMLNPSGVQYIYLMLMLAVYMFVREWEVVGCVTRRNVPQQ